MSSQGNTKSSHSTRSYPRSIALDFRKLAGMALLGYIDHYNVNVRNDAPPSELAVAVARHFEAMEVDEDEAIQGFLRMLNSPSNGMNPSMELAAIEPPFDGLAMNSSTRRRKKIRMAARPGEQVAAKVTRTDENGSWILASVQCFYHDTETYDVQDEDDTSKLIRLPWNHVMRLSTGTEGFEKNANVMAIFPETTSFYRAVVSKRPVWELEPGSMTPIVKQLVLKFEDDEIGGKTPHRRVPSRYIISLPSTYFREDDEYDLGCPSVSSAP
mmetsp:Transcript_12701/g.16575  ORF Transcript_12701/g.16575 Transcript_12701/m.16575 type:complete len:270 (+) Transcript_12701:165-974(+)|eukprot:CAMPEP_0116063018 /NCGR_PEP_ID=MMETSP0322-20121206/8145_1 /TAXON_ID=163516 /ORGANISM="Leptocylindrus danicus var. apora, Strain B651" /LENGTH=269 /DNA_ID=CAMNT_0003548517 /DNA_START=92 /DNA_END=901 /DNA_ORIENTATION=+